MEQDPHELCSPGTGKETKEILSIPPLDRELGVCVCVCVCCRQANRHRQMALAPTLRPQGWLCTACSAHVAPGSCTFHQGPAVAAAGEVGSEHGWVPGEQGRRAKGGQEGPGRSRSQGGGEARRLRLFSGWNTE